MSKVDTIAIGIVLYNPDMDRLDECLNRIKKQANRIYIFDNSEQEHTFEDYSVEYFYEKKNMGVAYALNQIMKRAKEDNYKWVVTMDQDSIIPEGMLEGFERCISLHENVGIVCPQVIDKRRVYSIAENNANEVYVDFCITSASCTSVEAWERCGMFDEWLFIDLVDNDFCKRLILSGYKIIKLNKWVLDQEFGKIIPKNKKKQEFWLKISKITHNPNFAKFSYKKFVSPMRVYYTNRNIIYENKKMEQYGSVGYENYNCKSYLGFVISFMLPSILRAQDKRRVIKATVKGIKDGITSKPTKWSI